MAAPPEKVFFDVAEGSYSTNPARNVDGFKLLRDSPTMDAYIQSGAILLGVRGTKLSDFDDVKADAALPLNQLTSTTRYQRDKQFVASIVKQYPPSFYAYYLSGHSLGGAIETQLKRDFPFMKYAVEFNPAFQPKDFSDPVPGIKRIYTSTDFLYKSGGKNLPGVVVQNPTEKGNLLTSSVRGHVLANFRNNYYGAVTNAPSVGIPRLGGDAVNLPNEFNLPSEPLA
jgi:hypothetical protein